MKIKEIIQYLEGVAPPALQEDYDNSGLLVGDRERDLQGILIALDCVESVVAEAVKKKCNLIIAHHPIIFRGLKRLTGANYIERTVMLAVRNDIAIYSIHTNLDHVRHGVNQKIADKLALENTQILRPKTNTLYKLTTFIPAESTEKVVQSLHSAGAGHIGPYSNCSFKLAGTGTFLPSDKANPTIGEAGSLESVAENRVEVILPAHKKQKVLNALFTSHPYEEVAYYLHELINVDREVGAGLIGELKSPLSFDDFLAHVKTRLDVQVIRHTSATTKPISRVALCGGAGSFLLGDAIAQRAHAFISADFKYHEFFDADGRIVIADIGHYESEQFTKELIFELLRENFANIALHFTEVNTNPIFYA